MIHFYKNKRIYRLPLLCIFALISAQPLYSNAKDPDFGLAAQPSLFFQSAAALQLLLEKLVLEHPQVKSQWQTVQAAGLQTRIAQQAYWPTPSVSIERAQSHPPDPSYAGSPQVLTFKVHQALWTGGRLTAQSDKAEAMQGLEQARLAEVQQGLAIQTIQAWAELVSAQRQQVVLRNSQAIQSELLSKMMRRVDQGLSSRSEAHYAQLRLLQAGQALSDAQQQESRAWVRLQQWIPNVANMGFKLQSANDRETQAHLSQLLTANESISLADWELRSLAQSPVLQRLRMVLQVQLAELAEKRAALQPEVYVRAEHQRGHYAYANVPPTNRVFIGLTASTGAGFSLVHQLAALQVKRNSTLEEIEAAQRSVIESVQTEYINAIASKSKLAALRLNLESSQELQLAWERQFINGKKSWIDVMNAARETAQAELAIVSNDMALLQTYWRLHILAHGVSGWGAP